eukprot:COSAG04_NODE_16595_length_494_cov_0.924051_1_plen_30_part_10
MLRGSLDLARLSLRLRSLLHSYTSVKMFAR